MIPNPKYLIDTNWLIDYLGGVEAYRRKFDELGPERLGVSVITMGEIYEGVIHSRDPEESQRRVNRVLAQGIKIVPLNDTICRIFGRIRGNLRHRGQLFGDQDIWIGATALHLGIPLCTNNRRHFERIAGLELISIP